MASKGLAALVPDGVNFTKSWQSKVSPRMNSVLSGLSKAFGETINVNSGYRSPAYNKSVKGAKNSLHMKGLAADIDMTGWSTAKRQQAIQELTKLGVTGFINYTNNPNMLHIDLRARPPGMPPHFMFDKYGANMKYAPDWFREMAAKAKPPNGLPEEMAVPSTMTRAQALSAPLSPAAQKLANQLSVMGTSKAVAEQMARDVSIAAAYGNPSRAQDVVSPATAPSPARPDNQAYAGPAGNFSVAGRKPSASDLLGLTAGLDRPNPANRPGLNMPAGPTRPSPQRPDNFAFSGPAGNFSVAPAARPSMAAPNRAPVANFASRPTVPGSNITATAPNKDKPGQLGGPVGNFSTPATSPHSTQKSPAQSQATAVDRSVAPANPGQLGGLRMSSPALSAPVDRSVTPSNPSQLGGVTMSNPKGNFSVPGAPTTADLAAQYGQYRTPTNYPNVRTALNPPPAQPLQHPISVPPTPVLAPALAPPTVIRDLPVYQQPVAAPAVPRAVVAPALRPSDIYGGQIGTALDSQGNTIGRDAFGNTTVSNRYGATTAMTPGGYQSAYGGVPGGSLPGIEGPDAAAKKSGGLLGNMSPQKAATMKATIGLGVLGAALGGPAGGLVGAMLGNKLSKPGGLLSGTFNVDTSMVNLPGIGPVTAFAKPQGGLGFPDAPSGGYGSGGRMGASYSNRSRADMDSISPGASAAIGKGLGGLY